MEDPICYLVANGEIRSFDHTRAQVSVIRSINEEGEEIQLLGVDLPGATNGYMFIKRITGWWVTSSVTDYAPDLLLTIRRGGISIVLCDGNSPYDNRRMHYKSDRLRQKGLVEFGLDWDVNKNYIAQLVGAQKVGVLLK